MTTTTKIAKAKTLVPDNCPELDKGDTRDKLEREARFARELLDHPLAATVIQEITKMYDNGVNFDADHNAIGTLLVAEAFRALREKAGVVE